ncbi:MAG: hypothetical protein ABSC94_32025 [Polyangiaceae bacterium]|jgi:hypothetical protein
MSRAQARVTANPLDELLDILALPDWRIFPTGEVGRFAAKHVGIPCQMRWSEIVGYLSRGVAGNPTKYPDPQIAKAAEGGWAAGLYRDNWRESNAFIRTQLMTIDIDGHGEVRRAASALARFCKAIHSTYKSTPEAPRCRVVLLLSKPCIDRLAYKRAHAAMREQLYTWGYARADKRARVEGDIDEGASDVTRLNYAPMFHPSRSFEFLATGGAPLDLSRIPLAPSPLRRAVLAPRSKNPDAYREGALQRAEHEVRTALEGQRHGRLFREAASLARPALGLKDADIYAALLPAFIAAAGLARGHEGERTIADGIARGRAGT